MPKIITDDFFEICREKNPKPEQIISLKNFLKQIDVNFQNEYGISALLAASDQARLWSARLLLENGANPNIQDRSGHTPLHKAILRTIPAKKFIDLLIEYNVNVNIRNKHGNTPLHCAIYSQSIELVQLFIENGADLKIKSSHDSHTLYCAIYRAVYYKDKFQVSMKILKLLIEIGADLEPLDEIYLSEEEKFSNLKKDLFLKSIYELHLLAPKNSEDKNLFYNKFDRILKSILSGIESTKKDFFDALINYTKDETVKELLADVKDETFYPHTVKNDLRRMLARNLKSFGLFSVSISNNDFYIPPSHCEVIKNLC